MPVVVTGADRPLGRALVRHLAAAGVPDLRAVVRDPHRAAPLRAADARVSVGDLSDPLRLGAVLEGAYTVVHLDAGPDGGGSPLDTWDWLLDAAEDTGLRRIVTVLPPGTAAPESPYETVVVPGPETAPDADPDPALVAALAAADRRG
jgi:uncharacterized protein YbjT (DUF2867 family)